MNIDFKDSKIEKLVIVKSNPLSAFKALSGYK